MRVTCSKGFSLIEIVVAIALIAIMATIIIPRVRRRPIAIPDLVRQELNILTRTAQTNALMTGKLHRIFFDLKNDRVRIEIAGDQRDGQEKVTFAELKIPYVTTSYPWDPTWSIERFEVQGKNLVTIGEGVTMTTLWFFIVPEGLAQEVTMQITPQNQRGFTLVLNPFTAQFAAV